MLVEASLHETSNPGDPIDPKHAILARIGILDAVDWVPTGAIYEVRGGPVGQPFVLPDGFAMARAALTDRFPSAKSGIAAVLGDMERITVGLGTLSRRREAFRNPQRRFGALLKLAPLVRDWRRSVGQVFDRAFGGNEALKCALAANLPYWHDDPDTMWWILFAVAQGGYLASGGRYVRGGSARLSHALADATTQAGGEIVLGRQATDIRLDADGRPSGVVHVDRKAASRWRRGRRSLSPMRLRRCSRPCCQPRREAVSGRPMPASLCRFRCFRRRSDCRCVRRRLAFEAIRHSCCRPG